MQSEAFSSSRDCGSRQGYASTSQAWPHDLSSVPGTVQKPTARAGTKSSSTGDPGGDFPESLAFGLTPRKRLLGVAA